MFIQSVLIGIISGWQVIDRTWLWSAWSHRPIVIGVLVGLVLGDIPTGTITGAYLELIFMGAVSMGFYTPPDVTLSSAVATAFVIHSGLEVGAALTLATPIAVLSSGIDVGLFDSLINPTVKEIGIRAAKKGNEKGVFFANYLGSTILFLFKFSVGFSMFYFGAEAVSNFIVSLPEFVSTGFSVAGGILPAIGFAMLVNMVYNKKTLPFFVLGFILTSYLGMNMLGILVLALIVVAVTVDWDNSKGKEEVENDNDF